MNARLALVFGLTVAAASAQARPYLIAGCPAKNGIDVGAIVLNTNYGKTQARSVTVEGLEFGTQTQVVKQTVSSLKYVAAGAGMYRIEFTDLEDGRSVASLTLEQGVEPQTDDELFQGTTRVMIEYVNGEVEYFTACNIVNEALLRKLAK